MKNVFKEVQAEQDRQIEKWGEQNHPCLEEDFLKYSPDKMCEWFEIPTEERAKHLCDEAFAKNYGTYAHIAIEEMSEVVSAYDIHKRREELVQLTAVCVSWLQKIDRDIENLK